MKYFQNGGVTDSVGSGVWARVDRRARRREAHEVGCEKGSYFSNLACKILHFDERSTLK